IKTSTDTVAPVPAIAATKAVDRITAITAIAAGHLVLEKRAVDDDVRAQIAEAAAQTVGAAAPLLAVAIVLNATALAVAPMGDVGGEGGAIVGGKPQTETGPAGTGAAHAAPAGQTWKRSVAPGTALASGSAGGRVVSEGALVEGHLTRV